MTVAFQFKPMNMTWAAQISTWTYEKPYDFYNFEANEALMNELMNDDYLCVLDGEGELTGFFCYGPSARVPGGYAVGIYEDEDAIDIGLGLEPSRTGKGLGFVFVKAGIAYFERECKRKKFRLVVASFNRRAIRVYQKNGFVKMCKFSSKVNGKDVEFLCMTKGWA